MAAEKFFVLGILFFLVLSEIFATPYGSANYGEGLYEGNPNSELSNQNSDGKNIFEKGIDFITGGEDNSIKAGKFLFVLIVVLLVFAILVCIIYLRREFGRRYSKE